MSTPDHITIQWAHHASVAELSDRDQQLVAEAVLAAQGAYAPYSRFHVGAALRLADGRVVRGSNQENASFPVGTCAERAALHAAMSQWPGERVEVMAVVVPAITSGRPVSPCGICRQALLEQEMRQGAPMRLLLGGPEGPVIELANASCLLPLSFDASFLKP